MSVPTSSREWRDPAQLILEAKALFAEDTAASTVAVTAEAAIRRAHELVSSDLYVVDQLKQAGLEPDIQAIFGARFQEKVAALVFLTKRKLLDIEQAAGESRDTDDARRDLATYVEILFRVRAIDALKLFFDLALTKHDSPTPWLWQNVAARCLYLMAFMRDARERVVDFLHDRPDARRMLEELAAATTPEITELFRALMTDYNIAMAAPHRRATVADDGYLAIVQQYEKEAPISAATGLTSLLTAQDRIQQAVAQGDISSLTSWIAQGSPAAMQSAFHQAMTMMPMHQYMQLLQQTLAEPELDPVRMTVVVMELGAINRASYADGGSPALNEILGDLASHVDERMDGVAKLAVRELAAVKALSMLQTILGTTNDLEVAEDTINALVDLRRLPLAESLIEIRPELASALQAAQKRHRELQSLMDAACSCPSIELASIYLERLRELNAVAELEQITQLQCEASEMAEQMVNAMKPERLMNRRRHA